MIQVDQLMTLMDRLEERKIWFTIHHERLGAISLYACVPGERWEIDFLEDGTVDVEIFRSDGTIYDGSRIEDLIAKGE